MQKPVYARKRKMFLFASIVFVVAVAFHSWFQPLKLDFSAVQLPLSVYVFPSAPDKRTLEGEDAREVFRLVDGITFERHWRAGKIYGYDKVKYLTLHWTDGEKQMYLELTVYGMAGRIAENKGLRAIVQFDEDESFYADGAQAEALLALLSEKTDVRAEPISQ